MDRRHYKILFLIGCVLGIVIVGVSAVQLQSSDTGAVSDGVTYVTPTNTSITLEGTTDVAMEDLFRGSDALNLTTTDGIIEFSSQGQASGTIHKDNITGTYTRVSQIEASNNQLTINPEDKPGVTVGKNIDRIEFTSMSIDDGVSDFIYQGPDGTNSLVTVNGLAADTQVRAVDADTGALLDGGTTDSSGTVTFDNLDNSEHTVELKSSSGGPSLSNPQPNDETIRTETPELSVDLDDPDLPEDEIELEWYVNGNLENTTTVTSAGTKTAEVGPLSSDQVYDWSVQATDANGNTDTVSAQFELDHYDPEVSDITPTGDLDAEPTQITAQINDSGFNIDGDSVEVDIILDGSVIDTKTITSNQEISTSMPSSGQTGGEHTIEIEATDSYSQTTTESQSYRVPDTLFVRNETQYSDLVAVDGSVRFFQGDSTEGSKVFERSANNGKINLTGLPVNQDFVVEVNPTDSKFTERTIYLESLYEQENAYVLNTSITSTIESRFVLNDPTGRFGSSSVLKIQRPIRINGDLIYQTIVADRFGTEGVTATLEEETRYQLRVSSQNFEQTVGPYRADTSETVEVQPGTTSIDLSGGPETWVANAVIDENDIEFAYEDPQDATTKLTVWIYERGNKSNSPVANQTFMDIGTASAIVQVPENQADKEWVVEFVVNRDNEEFSTREVLSNRKNVTPPIDPAWQALMAIGALVLLAGAFSVLNAAIGAVIVSLFGGLLFFLGFLSGATSGIAVGIAIFVSVVGHIMSKTR